MWAASRKRERLPSAATSSLAEAAPPLGPLHLNLERRRREACDTVGGKDRDGWLTRERCTQRAGEIGILDHIGAGFARPQIVVEAEEMRTKRRIERAVGDVDAGDRLGVPGKLGPNAEDGEEAFARRRQRRGAGIGLVFLRRLGVDERHAKSLGCESGESKRERRADKAAAGNDDVVSGLVAVMALTPLPTPPRKKKGEAAHHIKSLAFRFAAKAGKGRNP